MHQQLDWLAGLKTVMMVVRIRHLWDKTTHEVQFYLTTLESDARKLGQAIRLYWTMDATFNEDACRIRTKHAPQNLALL